MRKHTMVLILSSALAVVSLSLAGCSSSGGGGGGGNSSGGPTPTATASPSTAPAPSGSLKPIDFSVTSAVSPPTDRIGVSISTDSSLAGKQVAIIKTTDGKPRVIATGITVASDGSGSGWVFLQQSGDLRAVVAEKPLSDGEFDPATPLVAESGTISITIQ